MDILFFITTLITGMVLGVFALGGVIAIVIRKEDERIAERKNRARNRNVMDCEERRVGPNPFN